MTQDITQRAVDGDIAVRTLARIARGLWGIPGLIAASAYPGGLAITTNSTASAIHVVGLIKEEFYATSSESDWTPKPFPIHAGDPMRGNYRDGVISWTPTTTVPVTVSSIWKEEA